MVPQELVFDPFFTVRETLRIQSGYFGIRANDAWIDEVMEHLDLTAKADANMRALSGGMKRRVLIAQALVHKPPVIVLDEPTAGVDVELRQGLWQFVRRLNRRRPHHRPHHALPGGSRGALHPHRHAQGGGSWRSTPPRNLLARFAGSRERRVMGRDGKQHVLEIEGYGELERELARLRAQGVEIADIELDRPDLEEVFLRLTS